MKNEQCPEMAMILAKSFAALSRSMCAIILQIANRVSKYLFNLQSLDTIPHRQPKKPPENIVNISSSFYK
jgi:hypothetical protein